MAQPPSWFAAWAAEDKNYKTEMSNGIGALGTKVDEHSNAILRIQQEVRSHRERLLKVEKALEGEQERSTKLREHRFVGQRIGAW